MKAAVAAVGFLLLTLTNIPLGSADATCPPGNSHVWFLGVADDSEERADFIEDLFNFEKFLDELRDVYCIPDSQSEILGFDGSFSLGGTSYTRTEASEENVKSYLDSFGSAASAHTDSIFFYFHSSHGLMYTTGLSTCPLTRTHGSFAALHADTGAQDGFLDDCELGTALNNEFDDDVQMFIAVDCSFCGGFSDSLTAASGTITDGAPTPSGILADNRIVMTGCAITTECFGGGVDDGGVFYDNLEQVVDLGISQCDGWTAPGFPLVQGVDAPVKNALLRPTDGVCTASEWFFSAVNQGYTSPIDAIAIQQQFRMKFGDSVTDFQVMG